MPPKLYHSLSVYDDHDGEFVSFLKYCSQIELFPWCVVSVVVSRYVDKILWFDNFYDTLNRIVHQCVSNGVPEALSRTSFQYMEGDILHENSKELFLSITKRGEVDNDSLIRLFLKTKNYDLYSRNALGFEDSLSKEACSI